MAPEKKRIEFIDLAKGICIILVVFTHLVPELNDNLEFIACFRMPLYFCLSGLFYKDYGGFKNLTIRKAEKIFIPFIAWYLISYGIYYAGRALMPADHPATYHITDLFTTTDFYNVPIWFLLCLFWSNLIFSFIRIFAKNDWQLGIGVLGAAAIGWLLAMKGVFNFLFIGSALSSLPYFYLGYILKRSSILYPSEDTRKDFIIMIVCIAGGLLFAFIPDSPPRFTYLRNTISHGNPLAIYLCAALFVIGILLLCKFIKRIPFVSWLGRYSIIVLVTHLSLGEITPKILNPLLKERLSDTTIDLINFTLILALMGIVIPVCIKYLPHITAQKDFLSNRLLKKPKRESDDGQQ